MRHQTISMVKLDFNMQPSNDPMAITVQQPNPLRINYYLSPVPMTVKILYTALNLPSLILAQQNFETDSRSLEYANSPILLHNPLYANQLAQF